jgi:hypothetical protein
VLAGSPACPAAWRTFFGQFDWIQRSVLFSEGEGSRGQSAIYRSARPTRQEFNRTYSFRKSWSSVWWITDSGRWTKLCSLGLLLKEQTARLLSHRTRGFLNEVEGSYSS